MYCKIIGGFVGQQKRKHSLHAWMFLEMKNRMLLAVTVFCGLLKA